MKIVGNTITFKDYTLEDACRRMAALGFQGVEPWKEHLSGCRTPALLTAFAAWTSSIGLELCGLNSIGTGESYYFRPLEDYTASLQGLRNEVEYALVLDIHDILMWEGVRPQRLAEPLGETLKRLASLFREAVSYASDRGVRILVEPHPFTFGIDPSFLVDLCDMVESDFFGVTYDCCHYGVGRPNDYLEDIRTLNKRIKHIHFSDSDQVTSELHLPPGVGCLDLDGIVGALAGIGFDGTITLDLYGYPLPEEGARTSIPYLRKVIEQLGI